MWCRCYVTLINYNVTNVFFSFLFIIRIFCTCMTLWLVGQYHMILIFQYHPSATKGFANEK